MKSLALEVVTVALGLVELPLVPTGRLDFMSNGEFVLAPLIAKATTTMLSVPEL
jgi:hypothetical protein